MLVNPLLCIPYEYKKDTHYTPIVLPVNERDDILARNTRSFSAINSPHSIRNAPPVCVVVIILTRCINKCWIILPKIYGRKFLMMTTYFLAWVFFTRR